MRRSDVLQLIRKVNATWANAKPIVPPGDEVWFEDLEDLSAEIVAAAFRVYRRAGHEFPPPAAKLRQLALDMNQPAVTFEQVWGELQRQASLTGRYREAEAMAALTALPFACELVQAMGGWQQVCNAGPDEAKPTDPGVWRSQAEHAFKALVGQRRDDQAAVGLPGPRGEAAQQRLAVNGMVRLADAIKPRALPSAQEAV